MTEYPRPWQVEQRLHKWWVVDANGGIVAGGFDSYIGADLWLAKWPNPQPVYDYDNQAWMVGGRYVDCGHPADMVCGCFGRRHKGEARANG